MHSMALQFYSKEYTQQKCMHILLINKRLQEYSQQHYLWKYQTRNYTNAHQHKNRYVSYEIVYRNKSEWTTVTGKTMDQAVRVT